jgi:dCTP deaminase
MNGDALALFPELLLESTDSVTRGILPVQRLEELVANGNIRASTPIGADQIQPSSIDLRLGKTAYRVSASFATQYATVEQKLQDLVVEEVDLSGSALLKKGPSISCRCRRIVSSGFYFRKGESKSSTGRLDIFTRLITDYGQVRRRQRGTRETVRRDCAAHLRRIVREGSRLNQLRLSRGAPRSSDTMLREMRQGSNRLFPDASPIEPMIAEGLQLSIDLEGTEERHRGYRALHDTPPIDLQR